MPGKKPKPATADVRARLAAAVRAAVPKSVTATSATVAITRTYGPGDHLAIALSAAVPLRIWELECKGGPDQEDRNRATAYADVLGERGDVLQFGGGKKGEVAGLFNGLAHAIAVLAFVPGGVRTMGMEFAAGEMNNDRRKGVVTV